MIGKLKGLIDSYGEDFVILDVQGVGYVVQCSARTLQKLPAAGEAASLAIETQVREDAIRLFGFTSDAERDWFRLLTTVQGVGAKVALAILGVLAPDDLSLAIAAQDKVAITRAPGVGPKLGARIVAELKDKAGSVANDLSVDAVRGAAVNGGKASAAPSEDAVSALVNLGYRRAEAYAAVAKGARDLGDKATLDGLIRFGLKELSQ